MLLCSSKKKSLLVNYSFKVNDSPGGLTHYITLVFQIKYSPIGHENHEITLSFFKGKNYKPTNSKSKSRICFSRLQQQLSYVFGRTWEGKRKNTCSDSTKTDQSFQTHRDVRTSACSHGVRCIAVRQHGCASTHREWGECKGQHRDPRTLNGVGVKGLVGERRRKSLVWLSPSYREETKGHNFRRQHKLLTRTSANRHVPALRLERHKFLVK